MPTVIEILTLPKYAFLLNAFILSTIAGILFGMIGTFVVARRIGYLAGAISHCAFGGIGAGLFLKGVLAKSAIILGLICLFVDDQKQAQEIAVYLAERTDPVFIAGLVAVLAAILVGLVQRFASEREDSLIGTIWAAGMAIGILFLDRTEGYAAVDSYFFGEILLISRSDIWFVGILTVCILTALFFCFQKMTLVCFDAEFAKIRGIHTEFYLQLLLIMTALTVVTLIRVVGMILVIALLTIPPTTASRWTKRLRPMIFLSIFFCLASAWLGIIFSYILDFSTGPMIILTATVFYILTLILTTFRNWFGQKTLSFSDIEN